MGCRIRVYIWQIPVRLTHWVNFVCIVILSFTGYYIHNPYILVSAREPYGLYFMGWMRYIHFVTAFVFVASILLRTYWAFAGNQWASWRGLFPILTQEGRKSARAAFRYYFFFQRNPPEVVGHNALAGQSYMFIVFLYFVAIITGFALFGQLYANSIWPGLTGWVFWIFETQTVRLMHFMVMWVLIAFAIHHIYSAWLIDMEEGNGLMSSIFSGFKFINETQKPDWIEQRSNPFANMFRSKSQETPREASSTEVVTPADAPQ